MVSGPTYRSPPTPPVALSQVLDLNSEEPVYHTSEDELEHREREGSPHSQRSGDRDPNAMAKALLRGSLSASVAQAMQSKPKPPP